MENNAVKTSPVVLKLITILRLLWSFTRPTNALGTAVLFGFVLFVSHTPLTTLVWLLLASFSLPLLWFLNSFNDIYDHKSDKTNPKKNNIWYGYVLEKRDFGLARVIGYSSAALVIACVLLTKSWLLIIITLIGMTLGYTYSVPPLRLKEKLGWYYFVTPYPLLVFVVASIALGGTISEHLQSALISTWFLMTAIAALAEAADYIADRAAHIKTTATRYGIRAPLGIALVSWCIGSSLSFAILPWHFRIYCIVVAVVITLILLNPKKKLPFSIATINAAIAFSSVLPIGIEVVIRFFSM